MDIRIGNGYDVHAIAPGLPMWLGGVQIPCEFGFVAHSDGDVAIHALCDALLGCLALGDIGHLFPDTDPAWKGANSMELLKKTLLLPPFPQWEIVNADLTVVTQEPKMLPHIPAMRENLSRALSIDLSRVSIKAKTNERLGYLGAGEALESSAVVLLKKRS